MVNFLTESMNEPNDNANGRRDCLFSHKSVMERYKEIA